MVWSHYASYNKATYHAAYAASTTAAVNTVIAVLFLQLIRKIYQFYPWIPLPLIIDPSRCEYLWTVCPKGINP